MDAGEHDKRCAGIEVCNEPIDLDRGEVHLAA
jgi:hypothetical protein